MDSSRVRNGRSHVSEADTEYHILVTKEDEAYSTWSAIKRV
jgi:hypothetical protein